VTQRPLDGTSLAYTFDDAKAASATTTQYFEIFGNRAIYHDGWMASAFRGRVPWNMINAPRNEDFGADRWELYDLRSDFSQARDLAAREPGKLRELRELFDQQAAANKVLLHNASSENTRFPSLAGDRTRFSYRPGTIAVPEKEAPNTKNRCARDRGAHPCTRRRCAGRASHDGRPQRGLVAVPQPGERTVYRLRIFDSEEITLRAAAALEPGDHVLRYEFTTAGAGPLPGGKGRLLVNGTEAAGATVKRTAAFYSKSTRRSISVWTPAPHRRTTARPTAFTGSIEQVTIELL